MVIEPGSELAGGKYRVVRLLGKGAMGAVFEAENTVMRKRVALKALHAAAEAKPGAVERLIREAQAVARVRHPNVVDIYDVGRDGDTVFLVMEYLEGVPLSSALSPPGLPAHRIIALLLPAMRAVAAAHREGILHRDIKPDNLFLAREADTPDPIVKVLDFGISKFESCDSSELSLTRSGSTLGTPMYMSFEQLQGQKDLDRRTDVYAFGVILYQALTGRLPYQAETLPALIVQVMTKVPISPKVLCPELPTALDRIVMWALARERDERISSVEALVRELEPFASEQGLRAEMTLDEVTVPTAPTDMLNRAPPRARSVHPPASAHLASTGSVNRPGMRYALALALLLAPLSIAALVLERRDTPLVSDTVRSDAPPQAAQTARAHAEKPAGASKPEHEAWRTDSSSGVSASLPGEPTAPQPLSRPAASQANARSSRRRDAALRARVPDSAAAPSAELALPTPTSTAQERPKPVVTARPGSAASEGYRVGEPPVSEQF